MLKIALGSIPYYWPRASVLSFYEVMAETAVDIVYLGETVCSRRHEIKLDDWLDIAAKLSAAGKEVVLSTLVLIESGADLTALRKITVNGRYVVEANDMGAVHSLSAQHSPFIAGPHLNVYNEPTLGLLAHLGAKRWVTPLEMGREGLVQLRDEFALDAVSDMETEVFIYGRMPLAFSARCFTARYRNLPKDNCQFSCIDYPDGLLLQTKESNAFLILNGIQTQSARVCNLISEIPQMQSMGVDVVRISPQHQYTGQIIDIVDRVRLGLCSPQQGFVLSQEWMPDASCNGYWYGDPGQDLRVEAMAD